MITNEEKKVLAEHLMGLYNGTIPPKDTGYGICSNVFCALGQKFEVYRVALDYSEFEYYSGSNAYPISHPVIDSPRVAYETTYKWDRNTEYGKRRYLFCKYLADKIYNDISHNEGLSK